MADSIFKSCGVILAGCLKAPLKKVLKHFVKYTCGNVLKLGGP